MVRDYELSLSWFYSNMIFLVEKQSSAEQSLFINKLFLFSPLLLVFQYNVTNYTIFYKGISTSFIGTRFADISYIYPDLVFAAVDLTIFCNINDLNMI